MQSSALCENPLLLADEVDNHGDARSQYYCKEFIGFDCHQFIYAATHCAEAEHHFDIGNDAQEQFIRENIHQPAEAIKRDVPGESLIRFVALTPGPILVKIVISEYTNAKPDCLGKPGWRSLRNQVIDAQIQPEANEPDDAEFGDFYIRIS